MAENGGQEPTDEVTKPLHMGIVYDMTTGTVKLSIPKDIAQAYVLMKMLMDGIFQQAMNPEPDRQVKTLDELGMNPRARLHRG